MTLYKKVTALQKIKVDQIGLGECLVEHCLVQETWLEQQEDEERTATHKGKLGLVRLCSIR